MPLFRPVTQNPAVLTWPFPLSGTAVQSGAHVVPPSALCRYSYRVCVRSLTASQFSSTWPLPSSAASPVRASGALGGSVRENVTELLTRVGSLALSNRLRPNSPKNTSTASPTSRTSGSSATAVIQSVSVHSAVTVPTGVRLRLRTSLKYAPVTDDDGDDENVNGVSPGPGAVAC